MGSKLKAISYKILHHHRNRNSTASSNPPNPKPNPHHGIPKKPSSLASWLKLRQMSTMAFRYGKYTCTYNKSIFHAISILNLRSESKLSITR